MKVSIKIKIILGSVCVILVSYLVTAIVGTYFISTTVREQGQDKVRLDLNTAWDVYNDQLLYLHTVVKLASIHLSTHLKAGGSIKEAARKDYPYLGKTMKDFGLDFLTLTDDEGTVIYRARNPVVRGDSQKRDRLVSLALQGKEIKATQVMSPLGLEKEGKDLAERCYFKLIPTPREKPTMRTEGQEGLVLKSAVPLEDGRGKVLAVLYGGIVLNRNYQIVDRVKDIVYRGERFMGKDIGTCTIFLGDWRISTNVKDNMGRRALGTRISAEVYDRVLIEGKPWVDRAFVVTDWYITAYEPIKDIDDKIIGMLYVGYPEAPFTAVRNKTISFFGFLSFLSILLVVVATGFIAQNIVSPLLALLGATRKISSGDFSHRLQIRRDDELGELANSFNQMAQELEVERERLEVAYKELVTADKHKDDFLSMVSHELRTPLTSVSATISLLLSGRTGPINQIQREFLEISLIQSEKLARLIADLLDLTSIDSGGLRVRKNFVNLLPIIQKEANSLRPKAAEKELHLLLSLPPDLPILWIDGGRVGQVISNLLTNAIKFTHPGGRITLNVAARPQDLLISVQDTGMGLEPAQLARVFERFYQADGGVTREVEGAGLGLAIAKYIVTEIHGGEIWAESPGPGRGSTFFFTLPFKKPTALEVSPQEVSPDET